MKRQRTERREQRAVGGRLQVVELTHLGFGEFDFGGAEVFLNVFQVERHGDGDDARLHEQPRQRDLEDGGVARFRNGFERGIRAQVEVDKEIWSEKRA